MTEQVFMDTNGIHIVLKDLPASVRSFVVKDGFDGYCIIVNSRLNREQQIKAIHHENRHIRRGEVDDTLYKEYV